MKNVATYSVPFRRKREGKTNYKKRLALLVSKKPRLVIRKSLNSIYAQIINFKIDGDVVVVAVSSKNIEKFGWKFNKKNIPCAYLVGYLLGKKAVEKKITEAIVDFGLQTSMKGSKLYATVKGASDAGLKIAYSEKILPTEDRIKGKHICSFRKIDEQEFSKNFDDILTKIKGGK